MSAHAAKVVNAAIGNVINGVVAARAHSAAVYLGPKMIVRATVPLVQGRVPKRGNITVVLTMGRPNYRERKFVKACTKAGEPFPVRKIQFKYPPKRKG